MTQVIEERLGGLGSVGTAKETTLGTPVLPTDFIDVDSCTLQADPGWFSPAVITASRSKQVYDGYGQAKIEGNVENPLYPAMGVSLLAGSIGIDGAPGLGVTSVGASAITTLSASAAVGATTVTVTSATGIAANDIIQIDVNSATGPTTSECVTVVSIATDTLTITPALVYSHAASVSVLLAPANPTFQHIIIPSNTLPSFTIEKNLGDFQSEQYSGCRVNKLTLKAQSTNTPVSVTQAILGTGWNPLSTPSPIARLANQSIYTFAGASLTQTINGTSATLVAQAQNLTVNIDNGLQVEYTMANSNFPQFNTPGAIVANGDVELIWSSLTDPNWGYFQNMGPGAAADFNLAFDFQIPNTGTATSSISVIYPKAKISKLVDDMKLDAVIKSTITFEALRTSYLGYNGEVILKIVNSQNTPY